MDKIVVNKDYVIRTSIELHEKSDKLNTHIVFIENFIEELRNLGWQDNIYKKFSETLELLKGEISPIIESLYIYSELKKKEEQILKEMSNLEIPVFYEP